MPTLRGLDLDGELERELRELASRGLLRHLDSTPHGTDFVTNDYLGLARDPRMLAGIERESRNDAAGGRASRLLSGGGRAHEQVEAAAAEWLGAEAALFFASGYQANLGLVGALAQKGDVVISDALAHASLIDAARLSRATVRVQRHADLEHLEHELAAASSARRRLVLTEAVFSMDGDAAPLIEMAELCERYDAWLVIDEAHSAGLLGPNGAGAWAAVCDHAAPRVAARLVTGGKSLGAGGALVVGSNKLVQLLVNRARSFIFSTAPPPLVARLLQRGIELARDADDARDRCLRNARRLAASLGAPAPAATIVPHVLGPNDAALAAAAAARDAGFDVRAVRPPTVPPCTARLRLAVHADHTDAEIDQLAAVLVPRAQASTPTPESVNVAPTRMETALGDVLVVAGTDTGVGKTAVAAALLRGLLDRSESTEPRSRYWKPVQTGDDDDTTTVTRLSAAPKSALAMPLRRYPLPASPHEAARAADDEVPVEELSPELARLRQTSAEALVVELAGGLLVPYRDDTTQLDWLCEVGRDIGANELRIVLVARSGLGTLNHTLLSLEALRARGLKARALVLVGPRHDSNRETLRRMSGVERVIEFEHTPDLDAAAITQFARSQRLGRLID